MATKDLIYDYVRFSPTGIHEEQYTDVGTSFTLGQHKRAFLGSGFALRRVPGGTPLTRDVDYELDEKDVFYSGASYEGEDVFTKVNILNATYETGDLFVSYSAVLTYNTKAVQIYNSIRYGRSVGEIFPLQFRKTPTEFDETDPDTFFPALLLTDSSQTLSEDNYPAYVPLLRAEKLQVGSTEDFTGSAAGSVITLADNADNNSLMEALAEDQLFEGTYTDWRTVTWDGSDYPITDVDPVTREITVTGTPSAGAGTATFHPYRISGSATTARLLNADGLVLATAGTGGTVAGLRVRDQMQRITGSYAAGRNIDGNTAGGTASGALSQDTIGNRDSASGTGISTDKQGFSFDSADSPDARASETTDGVTRPRAMGSYLYIHVGRYIA